MTGNIAFKKVSKEFYKHNQRTVKELFDAAFKRQKTIEKMKALDEVSFHILPGETVGVIGKNGAGKSTLLKLIAGVSYPTSGEINVDGKISPLIELGAGFHPELTGRENIFLNGAILGISERILKVEMEHIIEFAELSEFVDTPVKYYSSGMYMRLAFAVAIYTRPEILLVDEILAVGDVQFQLKCLNKMNEFKQKGVTIVFVSHDLELVGKFCERLIVLNHGKCVFDGDVKEGLNYFINSN